MERKFDVFAVDAMAMALAEAGDDCCGEFPVLFLLQPERECVPSDEKLCLSRSFETQPDLCDASDGGSGGSGGGAPTKNNTHGRSLVSTRNLSCFPAACDSVPASFSFSFSDESGRI